MLTQSEFENWYREPVTQAFLTSLREKREETKENWALQRYVDEANPERSARLNLYALAGIDILGQVIEMVEEYRPTMKGEG